ncbi:MAG: hypothetical protein EZS28_010107 [Streblomastix strix]|uniref:Protein kinase domain-containing protein n=1 Tax=Streblomastix strix TaxID=222440 RepID=A0A5J4WHC5_9EUKA|nr:MAG: hypothetical protein EZS28_010107 [Streblomastix strix]
MTLENIAIQSQITLQSHTLQALMKQSLEGMKFIHDSELIHRDIKCDNILLHCPPGSGRIYVKIADFGLTKKEEPQNHQKYIKGTLPYLSPEQFHENPIITQKVDIIMCQLKCIKRPRQVTDDQLWNLLSRLLEFDPNKRITAAEALQHPYFTSPEAVADISKEQQDLASIAKEAQLNGDETISEFDINPTYIVAESELRIITKKLRKLDLQQQQNPLLYELKKNETVGMLFEIFNTKTLPEDKTKRCCIAIIIGYLFKSAPLPTEFTQNSKCHFFISRMPGKPQIHIEQ